MMKILLSNKFYYPKGGDCIHAIGLETLLKSKGHEVAFFAMKNPLNLPSEYESFFPSEVDYSRKNYRNIVGQVIRPLGSAEVKHRFREILNYFVPDIVHVHNIHSQLSPVIVEEAFHNGIPVVWSLHDYKMLCPRYDFRRDDKPCELCLEHKSSVLKYRCLKNSLPASMLGYAESMVWNVNKLTKYTSHFICPSEFIRQKMILGGIKSEQLTTINNFVNTAKFVAVNPDKKNYYCYVGRLSKEKGIETLLKAAMELPQYHLKVIGTGPLSDYLIRKYSSSNIEYCGYREGDEVYKLLSEAAFSVMPSECYENNPLAVIESLCVGTPVLGAKTGGIPELITENENGYTFESGNKDDLIRKIRFFWEGGKDIMMAEKIASAARKRFSSDLFYSSLVEIYDTVVKKNI